MSEQAPDGGPAPRRPAGQDPVLQLASDVQQLQDQHTQLASDLSEMGGEVATARNEVAKVATSLTELANSVAEQLGQTDEGETSRPNPVDWWTLDREQARETWDGLWTWVAEYLVPTFLLTRDELVDCWPRHPALRDLLTSMWVTQRHATAPNARPNADIEWQEKWRPGGLSTLAELTARLGCRAANCATSGVRGGMPEENELTRPAVWHREGIEQDLAARPEPPEPDADEDGEDGDQTDE